MRLDEYVDIERNERAERRRLAEEKSYGILDHLETFQDRFEEVVQGDSIYGGVSPSIFVGRSNYPRVSTGILSPVGVDDADEAATYETSAGWYDEGISIADVFRRRTSLLNTNKSATADVHDAWDGFVGTQREVAIADRPVTVEVGLDESPDLDFDVSGGDVGTPVGPRARAESAKLAENPHVPRQVKKTLEDDDWNAQGAMTYLYRRGFDVYDVNTILSAGALGRADQRKLVPTRWSITAVDDTVSKFLRGTIRDEQSVDEIEVYRNEFMGNAYWILLAPGTWEFELVEMKAPGSVWNPDLEEGVSLSSAREGYEGRTGYVEETAGAYYASRLGVLEHLSERGRQAKVLVLRHVSDEYWGPTGVWQVREGVRHAFEDEGARAETFAGAVRDVVEYLPVSLADLRRKSTMVAGLQTSLADFADTSSD